jgi:hypothetical protein
MMSHVNKSRMISNVVVVNVFALSNLIVDFFLLVYESKKGNNWNGQCNSGFRAKSVVFVSDRVNNLVKVAICIVGFRRDHFEHPRTILKHQRKAQIFVFRGNVFLAKLELIFFIEL